MKLREEEQETSQNVPLGTIDAGSFEVQSQTTVTPKKTAKSLLCWDEQSDVLQQADPWTRNAPKSISSAQGCTSVNFPACSVCQKLGVYSQQLQPTAPNVRSPVRGEGQPDEIPEEAAPNSNSIDEEWWARPRWS